MSMLGLSSKIISRFQKICEKCKKEIVSGIVIENDKEYHLGCNPWKAE